MNLDAITIFVKVVECGSFTKAAKLLRIPISTVSAKVSLLEARLGVMLLQRTTRQLQLTELGRIYFNVCSLAVEDIKATEVEISLNLKEPQGLLKITAPEDMGNTILPHIVHGFLNKYHQMEVEIFVTNRIVDLISEGIDLAIRAGHLKDSNLIARKFVTEKLSLWASPGYLEEKGVPYHPNDLIGHQFLTYSFQRDKIIKLINGKEKIPVTIQGRTVLNSVETAKTFALLGQGIGLLPDFQCRREATENQLIKVLPQWDWHYLTYYFLYPSQRFVSPKIRAFLSFAEEYMRNNETFRVIYN